MIRILTVLAVTAAGLAGAAAREPTADCSMFKKTSDGRWISTIDSKIGNPKKFIVLQAGRPIDSGLTIVGINVAETITRLCGDK